VKPAHLEHTISTIMIPRHHLFYSCSLLILSLLILGPVVSIAQGNGDNFWSDMTESPAQRSSQERWIIPDRYRALELDIVGFKNYVEARSGSDQSASEFLLTIPLPNGENQLFAVHESSVMETPLAQAYPEIKTFRGEGVDDPLSKIYLDITPAGFHAMILSPDGSVFIDPYFKENDQSYVCYHKSDLTPAADLVWSCDVHNNEKSHLPVDRSSDIDQSSILHFNQHKKATINMRTYRIAIATTGEYTMFHGGSVAQGLAAVNTALNRVRGVYETELAVSFTLVGNNDQLIYTDPNTDPYTNGNSGALLGENQQNVDNVIGSANYDVGHVFETGGGGLAGLGVICNSFRKAQGETGSSQPTGDPFWIDFVAHELGHQFAGNHTFNGSAGNCSGGNRNGGTAYEPASGSTIQAYAGICSPQNLQQNSDPYFHLISLMEMRTHVTWDD